ncbi:uncharacterized protein LOC8043963 [Ixodes scapularis]|uniref:uncharacterized protein LOC8043963 n=1 Tax=Ixodes scapularis TaxID=6945 RepID=UPI001A9F44D9|nr:uncharacterized protein LOC8043963 [Ixodes scapularis]
MAATTPVAGEPGERPSIRMDISYTFDECNQDLVAELLGRLKAVNSVLTEPLGRTEDVEKPATPLVHFVDPGDSEPMSDILGMEALDGLDERPVARQDQEVYDRQEVDGLEVAGVPDDLAELPEEIQLGIAKIKESLHCSDGSAADLLDLRFLATANPETVAAVCDEMETESVSDAKMAALLRSFVELKSETSLINGVVFTKRALLPKIESWKESSAPRLLVESIAAFVTALPQVSVEGLLVPLAQLAHPGKAQGEVLQAAAKEGIPKDYAPLCLRRILQESKANTEAMIGLIHCLVSKRGPLEGVLPELVGWLLAAKEEHSGDARFAKLLVDFLSICGPQMSPDQLESMSGVVSANRTFLKKPIENVFRKLAS